MPARFALALLIFPLVASLAVHAARGAQSDSLARADALLAPVRPVDCSTLYQTPPELSWPAQEKDGAYTLTLKFPDGRVEKRTTPRNFATWPRALPPGSYSWTVKAMGNPEGESEPRTFTIHSAAVEFVVPSAEAAVERAKKTPRPRSWAADSTSPIAAAKAERAAGVRDLVALVEQTLRQPLPGEPTSRSKDVNYDAVVAESKRASASAFA